MKWIGKRTLNGGYLDTARLRIAYRGFTIRPFIRRQPIGIGNGRLYCLGPVGLIVKSPAEQKTTQRQRQGVFVRARALLAPRPGVVLGAIDRPRTDVTAVEVRAARIRATLGDPFGLWGGVSDRRRVDLDRDDVGAALSADKIHSAQHSAALGSRPPDRPAPHPPKGRRPHPPHTTTTDQEH